MNPHAAHPASLATVLLSLWRNRQLIVQMTRREIAARYKGSVMGMLWSLITPIFMLTIYTFVFSVVFKARWGDSGQGQGEFAIILFAGLIVHAFFAEMLGRAPLLVLGNVNYVKKVVFPLEILPFVTLLSALFHMGVSLVVWLLAYVILIGPPHLTVLYLPLILLPLALLIMGLSWALASLGVYLRDVSQLIGVVTMSLMFLSPIFYPVTALPQTYRYLLYLNPLTTVIEQARAVLYFGASPDFALLAAYLAATCLVAWLGFAWFQKTRKGFADVL